MKKIASFTVDHDKLSEGIYLSRVDGDIVTYDIRMVKPNGGVYLENAAMHSFEHLFATFARNTDFEENIVYVGPMGCRTGFYFLVRGIAHKTAINIIKDAFSFIESYEGEIPGVSRKECGNYLEHNLEGAREIAKKMLPIVKDWTEEMLSYKE